MAGIDDLLGLGAPGGNVFNIVQGDGSAVPQTPVQQVPQFQHPHGIRNLLGIIGDALLVAHGKDPAYQNSLDQQQQSTALQGFLGDPDAAIQRLMQIPGQQGNAINLWKAAHPPSEKTMEQKVYEYEQSLPESERPAFEKSIQLTHPGMGAPLTVEAGTIGPDGNPIGSPSVAIPTVKDQGSYDAVPAGGQYTTDGVHIKRKPGGATASSPSPTF